MENSDLQVEWPSPPAPRRQMRPGIVCKAHVWNSPSNRVATIEVTLVVAANDDGYEVFGYRLDRLRHRPHMQNQRPRHYWVPINWL